MTSINYYVALGVSADALMDEICRAYQHYAPLCHPDSVCYNSNTFPIQELTQQEYWLLINEACEVLMNAEWRARYNVGMLKVSSGGMPAYEFKGDCMRIYHKFYMNPRSMKVGPGEELVNQCNVRGVKSLATIPTLIFFLELELEDIFHGNVKVLTYPRMMIVNGRYQTFMQSLHIPVQPYMRHMGSFFMHGYGHEGDNMRSDIMVVFLQNPHPIFTTAGDDLICNATIPLSTALFGGQLKINTIDLKTITTYINPSFPTAYPLVKKFEGEGMKTVGGRGDMIVNIKTQLPYVPLHMREEVQRLIREVENSSKKKE